MLNVRLCVAVDGAGFLRDLRPLRLLPSLSTVFSTTRCTRLLGKISLELGSSVGLAGGWIAMSRDAGVDGRRDGCGGDEIPSMMNLSGVSGSESFAATMVKRGNISCLQFFSYLPVYDAAAMRYCACTATETQL